MSQYNSLPNLRTPEELFSLKGKVGAIVGGGGKMSRSAAFTLASAGASLALADIQGEAAEESRKALPSGNLKHTACALNSADEKSVKAFFQKVHSDFGKLDFLIYNVMAKPEGYYRSLENYSKETWDSVLGGNLSGAFLCGREAAQLMEKNPHGGSVVLTSSIYGSLGPDQRIYKNCSPSNNPYSKGDKLNAPAAYSASKAGILGLSRYFSTLWGEKNIRVNAFTPGGVYDGQEESFHAEYTSRVPMGRMAVWSDYNGPLLFLVSDASRYMTGTNLTVDGGWSAW